MKNYEQMAQSLFERRDAYLANRKRIVIRSIHYGIPVISIVLIVTISVLLVSVNHSSVLHSSSVLPSPSDYGSSHISNGSSLESEHFDHSTAQVPSFEHSSTNTTVEESDSANTSHSNVQSNQSTHHISAPSQEHSFVSSRPNTSGVGNNSDVVSAPESSDSSSTKPEPSRPNHNPSPTPPTSVDTFEQYRDISQEKVTHSERFDFDWQFEFWLKITFVSQLQAPSDPNPGDGSHMGNDGIAGIDPPAADNPPISPEIGGQHDRDEFLNKANQALFIRDIYWMPDVSTNGDFSTHQIELNDLALIYRYRHNSCKSNKIFHLQLVLYIDQAKAKTAYQAAKAADHRIQLTYKNIDFYAIAHNDSRNSYTVFWEQDGMYCMANAYDSIIPIEELPPLVYLQQYPFN